MEENFHGTLALVGSLLPFGTEQRGGGRSKKVTLHVCNFGHLVVADSVKLFSLGTIIIDFFYVFISRPLTGL